MDARSGGLVLCELGLGAPLMVGVECLCLLHLRNVVVALGTVATFAGHPGRAEESSAVPDHSGMNHDMTQKMPDMDHSSAGHQMAGMYGPYPMGREASGTSWQPESTPHQGIHHNMGDEWMTMVHGFANLIYDDQGGPRGDTKTFSTSMLMLMAQRPVGRPDLHGQQSVTGIPV